MAVTTPICEFGWKAVDFDLEGVDGRRYGLDRVRGERATLVMFICNHCPYVKAVIDDIVRDARELEHHAVGTIAIMPNDTDAFAEDSFENMQRWSAEKEFPFPYVIDRSQETARAYGAACTPDFYGFNSRLELQYRGRIEEVRNLEPVEGARRELLEAMVQIAETGEGPREQIPSMGCSVKWRA